MKIRGFLWCQGLLVKGKAKVAWDSVCTPKFEEGLGIRRIKDMNKALMTSHVWRLITNRKSLWVKWVHTYKLKGRSFWDVPIQSSMSWGWRKLLQLRSTIRPFIWTKIGDGSSSYVWFDKWSSTCPLRDHMSPKDITGAGFSITDKVADLIENGNWKWPIQLLEKYPVLIETPTPQLVNQQDSVLWCTGEGKEFGYSATIVWELIRSRKEQVLWVNVVLFSKCIPRHSFLLWLVMCHKLKTHDRMRPWDVGGAFNLNLFYCSLCQTGPDSHEHLLFECSYSNRVWSQIKGVAGLGNTSGRIDDIAMHLTPISKGISARSVIGRLVLAATVYYVWQERNNRMFSNNTRSPEKLKDIIMNTIRMLLATISFKSSPQIMWLLEDWRLPKCLLMDGDDPAYVA